MPKTASSCVSEFKEYSGFKPEEQVYIALALAQAGFAAAAAAQKHAQEAPPLAAKTFEMRSRIPDDSDLTRLSPFMGEMIDVTTRHLSGGELKSFSSYRFLFERLLGAPVRPWLPAAFCGAAAMPALKPLHRRHLLQSISEAAATAPGWSLSEPVFYPTPVTLELN